MLVIRSRSDSVHLPGPQHVVVDVLEVRHGLRVDHVQVAAQQRVDDLAHRQHHPAQRHQRLAQLGTCGAASPRLWIVVAEQRVLQALDLGVQRLDRRRSGCRRRGRAARSSRNGTPVLASAGSASSQRLMTSLMSKLLALADGDQRPARDECGDLVGGQLAGGRVEPRRVGGQEQVRGVVVELRAAGAAGRRPPRRAGAAPVPR